ncbi:hypothetical protein BKA62DRAFT_705114 [Auriculariales sp. MPI-PUGE-AT-0066]|nr:hypothetical protein BKA62DRAFT_705114 [Auriculariales sp. MPI-PUGE-AT-0066]
MPGSMGVGKGTRTAKTANSFVMFAFYGSSVSVYGSIRGDLVVSPTLSALGVDGDYQPTDGLKNGTDGIIFEIAEMAVGWHSVKLTITKNGTGDAAFGFDHVVYTTGLPSQMHKTKSYLADDNAWDLHGQWSRNDLAGQNTRTLVTTDGNATANINLAGPSLLYLYGNVHNGGNQFQIVTSGTSSNQPTSWLQQGRSTYARENVDLWWFVISDLSTARVSIVNALWNNHPSTYELGLTRLDVYQTSGSSLSIDTATPAESATAVPTPTTELVTHKLAIGAIAGSIVGAVIFLVLAFLGVFFLRRLRRKSTPTMDEVDINTSVRPVVFAAAAPSGVVPSSKYSAYNSAFPSTKEYRIASGLADGSVAASSSAQRDSETVNRHESQQPPPPYQ